MIVVDASLAAKWVLDEPGSDDADAFATSRIGRLHAPDLLLTEVTSAVVRRVNMRTLSRESGDAALAHWLSGWDRTIVAHRVQPSLVSRAALLAIQIGHPLADCLYLALALQLDCPLATCDAKFRDKAFGHQDRIQLIATPH